MTRSLSLPQTSFDTQDPFAACLSEHGQSLTRRSVTTLQLNLGKMCNLACHHCHVEAGPGRTEIMTWETAARIFDWLDEYRAELAIEVLDLTGGAPEMNPYFRRVVEAATRRGHHVLDRCNLTILLEPGYEDMAEFLAKHEVEVVASLPCYLKENVDKQRGLGVYDESIEALKRLNALGYGRAGSGLRLDLVYNPVGYGLPPAQESLEPEYKRELMARFGITFNRLWTITNMPIKRFEHVLRRDGQYEAYMGRLRLAHRPENVDRVMCRDLLSIGWCGTVYDCDFNQMHQMTLDPATYGPGDDEHMVERTGRKLWDYRPAELTNRLIRTAAHCFGCTAGAGSSCTGALE